LSTDKFDDNESELTEGLIVTVFEDHGPENIYNSSPLNEDEAFNMAIKTLTVIGSDVPLERGEIRSYGPIPTPREPFQSVGFIFLLKATDTVDNRIEQFGRIIVFWVITRSRSMLKYIGVIKRILRRLQRIYQINTDIDLHKPDVLKKMDEKLRITDSGFMTYYISSRDTVEAFVDLAYVPGLAPVMLVEPTSRKIYMLLRRQPSPAEKVKYLQIANEYKSKLSKGSLFKAEIVTETFIIDQLLSKAGLSTQESLDNRFRIRLSDKITFEELDEFLDFHLAKKRSQLVSRILTAFEGKTPISMIELSKETGFTQDFIEDFLKKASESNVMKDTRVQNDVLYFD